MELEGLDLRWDGSDAGGAVLARAVGRAAGEAAQRAGAVMREAGLETELHEDDEAIWAGQRERQRAASADGAVVRVSALPAALEQVLAAAPSAVARAGLGLSWVRIDADPSALEALRARLHPAACVLLDAPAQMRGAVDPWGVAAGPELSLLRRVKERFDPDGVCSPGRYAGGL